MSYSVSKKMVSNVGEFFVVINENLPSHDVPVIFTQAEKGNSSKDIHILSRDALCACAYDNLEVETIVFNVRVCRANNYHFAKDFHLPCCP